jgi:hypothetical protein
MQVVHLHDHNPLHPFPAISEASVHASSGINKVKVPVEPLTVQSFAYAFDITAADPLGSPNKRQPWLSSVLFSHESKRRSFARSKLNHSVGASLATGKIGSMSPRSPHPQYNSPAMSRVTTAGVDIGIAMRSFEPRAGAVRSGSHDAKENEKETASGYVSDRSHRTPRLHFQDSIYSANADVRVILPTTSVVSTKEKDLQVVEFPALSSYEPSNGKGSLYVQSKALAMAPRAPCNTSQQKMRAVNLCDPVVPPLKLPLDELCAPGSFKGKDAVVTERKLRFSIPSDTYYQIRGSQSQRLVRSFAPYPISFANVSYPEKASSFLSEANPGNGGCQEPRAPARSVKSTGNTPRSPVVLSRTVFVPAQPSMTQSAHPARPKDHIVTAEMQMKGILIEAGAVSGSIFDPVVVNAVPMFSGTGPKAKSTIIGDKVWSKTAKNAAAADKS